jgi:hypothetical protein
MLDVTTLGAIGDNATDNRAILQAILDGNPKADLYFPNGTYVCSGPVYLSDITGRNFQGNLIGEHATLRFTNAGAAADTDAAMQNGLVAYTRVNALGGDTQGIARVSIRGLVFVGPANGCGLRLCNSQEVVVEQCQFLTNRYGMVQECCNIMTVQQNDFEDSFNAGLAFLYTANPAVWYGAAGINAYWNDGPIVKGNGFSSNVVGALAHILDHGSNAECVRSFEGNTYFNNGNNKAAFGYLGRCVSPSFLGGDWFENINYPIRILSDAASETFYFPGNFLGVTSAQPGGTASAASLPSKVSFGGSFRGMFFSRAVDDMNLTGLSYAPSVVGQNFSSGCTHRHLVLKPIGNLSVTDLGDLFYTGAGGAYMDAIAAKYYRDLSKAQVGAADSGGVGFRVLRVPN